jgi:FMN-dependent NADH-azoreductase
VTLFRLDASINPDRSASRAMADIVEAEWQQAHPGDPVIRRHVGTDPLPADAWANAVTGARTPEPDRSERQRAGVALAARLAGELAEANAVLLAVPLYNFGVSQHIKTWIDLVIAAPRDSSGANGTGPLLAGKPTVLVTVRGGAYGAGTPRDGWDHSTGYLRRILADVWGADLTVVEREFTLVGVNPALDQFTELAAELKDAAHVAAREAGRALTAAVAVAV